jgi:hypothetical protein
MKHETTPAHVRRVLDRLKGVRPTRDGWDALCPCPYHNGDGDQRPSLHVEEGEDGRTLLKCRGGCKTDAVLNALGLWYPDLFAPQGGEDVPEDESPAIVYARQRPPAADPDLVGRAYDTLLAALPLEDVHREDLRRRGLNDDEIDRRGYRTLRNTTRGKAAQAVHAQLGDAVLGVPGFARGPYGITIHGDATGLLVPVRDLGGRVVALKVRRQGEPKYVYLTGADDGPSPGSPVHVPLGVVAPAPVLRVTEGELKADVCTALDGTPTVGVPGVTQWRLALPLLKPLGATTVVIAYDAPDVRGKPPVFTQAEMLWQALLAEGFEVEVEDWDE